MKKKTSLFALLLLFLPLALLFSACGNIEFKIKFIVDGQEYAVVNTAGNETISMPENPAKTNYEFDGWYWDENVWQNPFTPNSLLNKSLSSNINIYSKWKEIEISSIYLNTSEISIEIGENYCLITNITPINATNKNIIWSSSNILVATVDNGIVSAINEGETIITATTTNSITATCKVTVEKENTIKIQVCIDGNIIETIKTDESKEYKIEEPQKPVDITINPNSDKYFYGWFLDSNFQIPFNNDTQFYSDSIIYGKWISVYDFDYSYTVSNGYATITKFNNTNYTIAIVPRYINSFPVNCIGRNAFKGQSMLRTIIISADIETIRDSAFSGCSSLTSINLPNSLKNIGGPDSSGLGSNAFSNCSSLTDITIPNTVTSLGNGTFSNCSSLTNITISNSLTDIGNSVFSGCGSLTSITIPNSVTGIGNYAFLNCSSLTSITVPNSVINIGESAFSGCNSLIEITLPFIGKSKNVPKNEYPYPFGYIFGTNEYTGGIPTSQRYYISGSSFIYYIPNSLKSVIITGGDINYGAFENCRLLTNIMIGEGITNINSYSFYGCSSLNSITIPGSITNIGDYAFKYCISLTNIVIPNNITSIGVDAFSDCKLLTIYCERIEQPSDWNSNWNSSNRPVYWYSETQPTTSGNYWHYVNDIITKW